MGSTSTRKGTKMKQQFASSRETEENAAAFSRIYHYKYNTNIYNLPIANIIIAIAAKPPKAFPVC